MRVQRRRWRRRRLIIRRRRRQRRQRRRRRFDFQPKPSAAPTHRGMTLTVALASLSLWLWRRPFAKRTRSISAGASSNASSTEANAAVAVTTIESEPRKIDAGVVRRRHNDRSMDWNYGPNAHALITLTIGSFFLSTCLLHQVITVTLMSDDSIQYGRYHERPRDFFIGPCLVNTNQTCPDQEVTFYLYTRKNFDRGQEIFVNNTGSNLADTMFEPNNPTKIIVHGYNSDMQLDSLVEIRQEYLMKGSFNLIAVDWHRLAAGPCYPIAVHNVPHVGECLAQLINRLKDYGAVDIHAIGFSLGAHVPAFAANYLRPYKLPRITGLDPAMPLFITVDKDHKLDAGDAKFVDVFHTNAFIQGKVELSGHIDFYMNGGISQPGCWEKRNPFGCSHHRAAMYFAESINTKIGFWGWPCSGFFRYLLGLCPPRFPAILAGDPVDKNYRGFFLVKTRSSSPFAEGLITIDPPQALNVRR